jgi:hypothetical protein
MTVNFSEGEMMLATILEAGCRVVS